MNKKSVLVVSNKNTAENPLNEWTSIAHPFHVNIVNNDEAAIELLHQVHFDMVVVDGTDSDIDGRKLNAVLPILQDDLTVLKYEGETAMELENNVKAIFNAKKYQRLQRMMLLEPAVQNSWNFTGLFIELILAAKKIKRRRRATQTYPLRCSSSPFVFLCGYTFDSVMNYKTT